ncbi:MAG: hypothetical protein KC431_20545, partial [Myxococcales bacterium]|nr:hypothetical protein [Myxococcales bacterium]
MSNWIHRDSHPAANVDTVSALLAHRAATSPTTVIYRHLDDGEHEGAALDVADLWRRARALAAVLSPAATGGHADRTREQTRVGDRALLLFPQGLDFAVALWACALAGIVAVPVPAPDPSRPERER